MDEFHPTTGRSSLPDLANCPLRYAGDGGGTPETVAWRLVRARFRLSRDGRSVPRFPFSLDRITAESAREN